MARVADQKRLTSNLRDFLHLFRLEHRLCGEEYDRLMRCSDLARDRHLNRLHRR